MYLGECVQIANCPTDTEFNRDNPLDMDLCVPCRARFRSGGGLKIRVPGEGDSRNKQQSTPHAIV